MSHNSNSEEAPLVTRRDYLSATIASGSPFVVAQYRASSPDTITEQQRQLLGRSVILSAATLPDAKGMLAADVTPSHGVAMIVSGRNDVGDGYGGVFAYDHSTRSTFPRDGLGFADNAGRRWVRIFDGPINLKWFGAKGDGAPTTNDGPSIQAADAAAAARGSALRFSDGVYRFTASLKPTCRWFSDGDPGPRVYVGATPSYGGAWLWFDNNSVSDRFDQDSFAIQIIKGAVGSEGYANISLNRLGVCWTANAAGGLYVQGAVNVELEHCWLTGGKLNHDAGRQTGFAVYCRDAIVSRFRANTVRFAAFGLVAETLWNENVVRENNFVDVSEVGVLLRGKRPGSIRSTIGPNNYAMGKYAVYICGATRDVSVVENTIEGVALGGIVASPTDYLDNKKGAMPANIHVHRNVFIAFGANGNVGESAINLCTGGNSSVAHNSLRTPTTNCASLIAVNSASTGVVTIFGNDPDVKTLAMGDLTKCALLDPPRPHR